MVVSHSLQVKMAWNKQWNKQWLTETWILTFIHYLMMKCTLIRACWSGPAWWCWYWWCDDSQCSSTPHHTTPHHITYLHFLRSPQSQPASAEHFLSHKAILPLLPVYTRPPSRQDVAQPAQTAEQLSWHFHILVTCYIVTLRYILLLLWPTTSEQTPSVNTLQGGSHSPNNTYLHRINGMTRISFCLLIFKSPLPLKSP